MPPLKDTEPVARESILSLLWKRNDSIVYNLGMEKPYTTDTSHAAEEVQLNLWRAMSGKDRIQKMNSLSTRLRDLAFDAIRRRHPEFSQQQIQLKFIELTYGEDLATEMEKAIEPA